MLKRWQISIVTFWTGKFSIWEGPQTYWLVDTGPDGTPGINGGLMHRHFSQPVINTIEVESLEEMLTTVEEAGGKKIEGPVEIPEIGPQALLPGPGGEHLRLDPAGGR